ncbi:MAG TPA: BadF/BadG/BcrA/BcrD ATPase family protein, partial [Candidatus Kapabacteria bacterium]|nr:BadF/BadG/BcrA/BcrD ATPase family protein [Candidatus Kapabacteria bacterium]
MARVSAIGMMYIGIDGGGTKTRLFVQAATGEDPRYFEFPISLKVQNGDFAASARQLQALILDLLSGKNSDSPIRPIRPMGPIGPMAIVMGLSGMSQSEDQEALKNAILSLHEFTNSKIHIESDATLTLKTVLAEGEEGILLIAGTGSVVFYQPSGGPAHRIGGWGPLLSDEGSGYRIGLRALRQYIEVL